MFTQPVRELICKISELTYFTVDVIVGHTIFYIQLPIVFCPFANTWHSFMLLWVKPGSQIRRRLLSKKQKSRQRIAVFWNAVLFFLILVFFLALILAPIITKKAFHIDLGDLLPDLLQQLRQPEVLRFGRKGMNRIH